MCFLHEEFASESVKTEDITDIKYSITAKVRKNVHTSSVVYNKLYK